MFIRLNIGRKVFSGVLLGENPRTGESKLFTSQFFSVVNEFPRFYLLFRMQLAMDYDSISNILVKDNFYKEVTFKDFLYTYWEFEAFINAQSFWKVEYYYIQDNYWEKKEIKIWEDLFNGDLVDYWKLAKAVKTKLEKIQIALHTQL